MINPTIFRAYDIRGSSLCDLNYQTAYKIGFCFSKMIVKNGHDKICIGRDGRLSSPELYKGLVHGILQAGAKVISIGIVPTPTLYYADKKLAPAASIMITGSHNPRDDNGFKIIAGGQPFFDQQLQQLMNEINNINIVFTNHDLPAEIKLDAEYVHEITKNLIFDANLKIAWDAGNGAAGNIMQMLKDILPNKNILINGDIDGNFPNHHPDPSIAENLEQLINTVTNQNCDFGIAFDGDADRVGVVTRSGKIVSSDQLLCLFTKDILLNNPGATIIADVKTSDILFSEVKKYNGVPLMCKTGHSWIKNKMNETKALLAGEMSGHIFFADKYFGYDDGIYAALRFIDLISRSGNLEQMLAQIPSSYSTPELKIKIKDTEKFIIIDKIKQHLIEQKISFIDLDGVRVNTDHGWWLLRASNTQSLLVARAESATAQGLESLKNNLQYLLKSYNLEFEYKNI